MKKEYGLTYCNDINTPLVFTDYMEDDMPEDRIITIKDWDRKEGIFYTEDSTWYISKEMIEEIINTDPKR